MKTTSNIKLRFGWEKNAGMVALHLNNVSIHFGVHSDHWMFGRETEEYDRCLEYFGLGPLLLIAWLP